MRSPYQITTATMSNHGLSLIRRRKERNDDVSLNARAESVGRAPSGGHGQHGGREKRDVNRLHCAQRSVSDIIPFAFSIKHLFFVRSLAGERSLRLSLAVSTHFYLRNEF